MKSRCWNNRFEITVKLANHFVFYNLKILLELSGSSGRYYYYCYARYSKSSTVEVPSNTVFSRSRVSTQVAINA